MGLMQALKRMPCLSLLLLGVLAFVLTGVPEAQAAGYRASGTFTAGGGAITPPYPASMAANDVCLLVVESENQAISLTTANGFVQVPTWSPQFAGTAATNPASRLAVFWKRTVGGDAAPVVADSGNHTTARIHCFSGVATSGNPWDTGAGGNDGGANDTSGTIPGSTTTVNNALVVLITSTSFNGTSTAQCSGWTNASLTSLTERTDNTNTINLGGGHCLATGVKTTAGAYANTTVTLANTSFKGAISLALRPGPPGSVTGASGTAGTSQVVLTWTNPTDADLDSIVVLRNTVAVTDAPVDGTTYVVGNTIGTSTVACVVTAPTATCTDTGVVNGTAYHYKIFTKNTSGYYDTGVVPTGSPFTPSASRYGVATGNWNATTTWSTGGCSGTAGASVPAAGADVVICSGFTVTLNANSASLNSLTVQSGGRLRIGNNGTARTLTVTGSISNAGTLDVNTASNTTHSLVVGGDITNTGTFNLATDAGSLCNTTFNRNGGQTVGGAGATTRFNRITLNMGTTNANILDITATNFSINPAAPTNFLTLTNGTFKFSTTGTITPFTAAPTISATRGFWVNNAGATVSSGNFDWTVSGTADATRGLVRVTSGTLNLGAATANDLITGNFSDIVIEGGAINVGGVLRRALVTDNVRFNMSGGTLTVAAAGAPGSYPFQMESAASFTMSGGTIVIRNDGGNNGYQNLATTNNVTGGTLQIGDGSTAGGQNMGINSTVPVGNLLINSANATGTLVTNSLTVNGNVTIAAGTLNANNLNITLGGNWSRTGTFTPGTGTVTFTNSVMQSITGVTTFYNLAINNSTAVRPSSGSNLTINGNFTNTSGFDALTNSITTTFSGAVAQILTGITTFYDLVFSNAAGITLNNDITANNTLNIANSIVTTGVNALAYNSSTSCSISRTTGRVNGWLRKRFAASQTTCDFEIGNATNYTPVNVSFTSVSGSAPTVTAKATATVPATDHPEIATAPLDAANLVNRYWMLAPGGGLTFSNATLTFTPIGGSPVDHDNTANVGSYVIQRYEISGGSCDPADAGYTGAGSWNDTNELCGTCLAQTTTRIMAGDINTFGGICSHFVTGLPSISGFLREKEFIYQRELYY